MLDLKIVCHIFLCLFWTKPMWNWLIKTRDMPKELALFYDVFQTVPLYILWYQFITVHVSLPIPSRWLPLNFMLVFKSLYLNLLNIVVLCNLKVVFGCHPKLPRKIKLSSDWGCQSQPYQNQRYFYSNYLWSLETEYFSTFPSMFW